LSGRPKPGESVTRTFDAPGTYPYVCADHPWSIAELIVESN
jgi:plastocyanin